MYLTYADYTSMGGTLDETTFNDFEFESECIVNWYTFNRLKTETTYPEELSRCMYALIKLAKLKADAMTLGSQTISTSEGGVVTTVTTDATIASQSNDGVSVSYNSVSASEVFNKLNAMQKGGEIETLVQLYLNGVKDSLGRKLLYRGLYPNE
jgi:hypothetical protein